MWLNGDFELQLSIQNVIDIKHSNNQSCSQFSILQVCDSIKTVVEFDTPLSFNGCYTPSLPIYIDFK